jgi:hypothetical protein
MADIDQFLKKYSKYKSTFKETSFDSTNKYSLCKDETQYVINFDKIVEERYPDSNNRPKSFDALFIYQDNIFCIEFKNEKKPDKKEIEDKLKDGKKEFDTILADLNISKKDYIFIFCLVYNKYIPKYERYKRGLYKSVRFEYLKRYKGSLIYDLYTEDVNFFTKKFEKITKKELTC